jgi:hypothetical protein
MQTMQELTKRNAQAINNNDMEILRYLNKYVNQENLTLLFENHMVDCDLSFGKPITGRFL